MINIRLRKKAILKSDNIQGFSGSKCCVTISVGKPPHEGDKFMATLVAVNNNFESCRIIVGDSLQRHTMKIVSLQDEDEIYTQANALGEQWIERNFPYICRLNIPYNISRWDEWLTHVDYHDDYSLIKARYQNNSVFKSCVDNTATLFLERNKDKIAVPIEEALFLSKEYLIEECAVMLLLAKENCQFEIYPNDRNLAVKYVFRKIISASNPELMQEVSIKFKNRATGAVLA